jgi:hypothetical protein
MFSKEAIQLIGFEKLGIHINHTDLKSSTNRIQQRKKNERLYYFSSYYFQKKF